jgi:hypothetical protein
LVGKANKTFSTPKIINSHSFNVLEMGRVSILYPFGGRGLFFLLIVGGGYLICMKRRQTIMYRNLYRRHIR